MTPTVDVEKANRQCWDCLKRRLVCDFTLPHCKKCSKNGRQCSGYDEKKPLQWVEPGHILSRKRRKPPPKKQATTMRSPRIRELEKDCSSDEHSGETSGQYTEALTKEYTDIVAAASKAQAVSYIGEVLDICDRITIKLIVSGKRQDEAQKILKHRAKSPEKALMILEHLLHVLETEDIPTYNLRNDAADAVQAVHYLNQRMYPQSNESSSLVPNTHNIIFPMSALHVLPPSIHHTLVCLSLSHFVNSLPVSAGKRLTAGNWDKIYQHRGAAIRELTASIGKQKTRCSNATITSVMMFLAAEMQTGSQSGWRTHSLGLIQLFELRGGMMSLYRTIPFLHPTIVIFTYIVIYGNCSSPAGSQVFITPSLDDFLSNVSEMYTELFPYGLCPPSLFQEIVRINYLRYEASQALLDYSDVTSLSLRAQESLARIEAFDTRDWAQPGAHFEEWLTIGSIYKHSIAVYCIMSLSSLTILPILSFCPSMRKKLSSHGTLLLRHVKPAMLYMAFRRHLAFPLLVAGVEAIYRSESERYWIEEALTDLGQVTGASSPLKMRALLRRYWQRDEPGWEECFTQPYSLIM